MSASRKNVSTSRNPNSFLTDGFMRFQEPIIIISSQSYAAALPVGTILKGIIT